MKRVLLLMLAFFLAVCSFAASAEDAVQIRQVRDHTFSGGTMINPEAYPEVRLITHEPAYLETLSPRLNTVFFPLPDNTLPDTYSFDTALLIGTREPDCSISYEYRIHHGATLKEMMKNAPDYRSMVLDGAREKAYVNMKGSHAKAFLYLKKPGAILEIVYRVVDWDAYPDDVMQEVLKDGILAEKERVLSQIGYAHTDAGAWWTLGKYSGVSMLDSETMDHRVDIVFPELTAEVNGETLTARVYPYAVGHTGVKAFASFSKDVYCSLEFGISTSSAGARAVAEGSEDARVVALADGREWMAELYQIAQKQSTTFSRWAREIHQHGGLKKNEPSYLNVILYHTRLENSPEAETELMNAVVSGITDSASPDEP